MDETSVTDDELHRQFVRDMRRLYLQKDSSKIPDERAVAALLKGFRRLTVNYCKRPSPVMPEGSEKLVQHLSEYFPGTTEQEVVESWLRQVRALAEKQSDSPLLAILEPSKPLNERLRAALFPLTAKEVEKRRASTTNSLVLRVAQLTWMILNGQGADSALAENDPRLLSTMERLYPEYECLEFLGRHLPVHAMPTKSPKNLPNLTDCLAPLEGIATDPVSWPKDYNPACRERFDFEHSLPVDEFHHNGGQFVVSRTLEDPSSPFGYRLVTRPGWFYESAATSWTLLRELSDALQDENLDNTPDLPLRTWWHTHMRRSNKLALREFGGPGRSSEVSVSTLFVHRSRGDWCFVVGMRSKKVYSDTGAYHVAPSGKFGLPYGEDDFPAWFDLKKNIYRELLEECFDKPEWQGDDGSVHRDLKLMEDPIVADIEGRLVDGTARLWCTGLALSLTTLQIEICTLLQIDDPAWPWLSRLTLNNEFMRADELPPEDKTKMIRFARLTGDFELDAVATEVLSSSEIVPVGAACIHLGLAALRDHAGGVRPEVNPLCHQVGANPS